MTRPPDWELRLQRVLNSWRDTPFKWGETDCVHFAGDCLLALTGHDYTKDIQLYSTEREALRVLSSFSGEGMTQAVEIALSTPSDAVREPIKGDLVLAQRPIVGRYGTGPGLGVCLGKSCAFVGRDGLEEIATRRIERSWEI